jgi:DNA-binding XRE family transcriptional regulator
MENAPVANVDAKIKQLLETTKDTSQIVDENGEPMVVYHYTPNEFTEFDTEKKAAGITQQQLAERIGKKREYVAMLEKGETDMQLSTFIMISEAVGLKFALTY